MEVARPVPFEEFRLLIPTRGAPENVTVRIGLLRAVNVGGIVLRMDALRALLLQMGFQDVRTLLQSGNVVFRGPSGPDDTLERKVEARIARDLHVTTDVFLRRPEEWATVVAQNPFPQEAKTMPGYLVVLALKGSPPKERWDDLRATIPGPERVHGIGRHAYVVYPNGQGRSRFTAVWIEKRLGTRVTARNWNTVTKLADIAAEAEKAGLESP